MFSYIPTVWFRFFVTCRLRWRWSNVAGRQFLYSSLNFFPITFFFFVGFCLGAVPPATLAFSPPDHSGLIAGLYPVTPATPAGPNTLYLLLPSLKKISIFPKLFLVSTLNRSGGLGLPGCSCLPLGGCGPFFRGRSGPFLSGCSPYLRGRCRPFLSCGCLLLICLWLSVRAGSIITIVCASLYFFIKWLLLKTL